MPIGSLAGVQLANSQHRLYKIVWGYHNICSLECKDTHHVCIETPGCDLCHFTTHFKHFVEFFLCDALRETANIQLSGGRVRRRINSHFSATKNRYMGE